ncbi:Uncharacterised protein [Mycobacteroides abscessus subsp. abscessus]|nr:Uncharacterised protein [Mycobacteroides abscessus subsp. abscessus]
MTGIERALVGRMPVGDTPPLSRRVDIRWNLPRPLELDPEPPTDPNPPTDPDAPTGPAPPGDPNRLGGADPPLADAA